MEHLVDVTDLCLVEWVRGERLNRHFAEADDGEHVQRKG